MSICDMNYRDALEYLYQLRLFGTKLGLENVRHLSHALGNPQKRLRFIHVAGTNGKGSVCAYLNEIYQLAGFKTGMFTSPHLVRFGERLQINGKMIPDDRLAQLVSNVRKKLPELPNEITPTFFEFLTCMALKYFADQKCELVIWETGMGGRLDATNLVEPECSIVTNVSFDHQAWLGDSLQKIASEKAGIIKKNKPVVTGADQAEVLEVIHQKSKEQNAPLNVICADEISTDLDTGLKGPHQALNATIAKKAIELLQNQFPVSDAEMIQGIERTQLPGRFQSLHWRGRKVILDVAHNLAGYEALVTNCQEEFSDEKCELIFASLDDKPWKEGLRKLLPFCQKIHFLPANSKRSTGVEAMKGYADTLLGSQSSIQVHTHENLESCLIHIANPSNKPVLVTGSFYLVGDALSVLQNRDRSENSLNEWGAKL